MDRAWAKREDIAEIYDAMADKAADSAANGGGLNDVSHVVSELAREERLRRHAADIRATNRLGEPIGFRVA